MSPRKKTSLEESLAGSYSYNPIRDSRRDSWRDFFAQKVSPTVSLKVSPRDSARLSARRFEPKSLAESPGSDYSETSLILLNAGTCQNMKYQSLAKTSQSEPTVTFPIPLLYYPSTNRLRRREIRESKIIEVSLCMHDSRRDSFFDVGGGMQFGCTALQILSFQKL